MGGHVQDEGEDEPQYAIPLPGGELPHQAYVRRYEGFPGPPGGVYANLAAAEPRPEASARMTPAGEKETIQIFVDADACPVKQEVYRVAKRFGLKVLLVSDSWMATPSEDLVELLVVKGRFDAADDEIVERVRADDVVVTADIPLAARCLEKGARVLDPRGKPFTEESIGDALASRELMQQLRELGNITGGPKPFEPRDRSRFLHRLDEVIHSIRRGTR